MLAPLRLRLAFQALSSPLRGALWMLFAALMFAAMGGGIRQLAELGVHPLITGFFRSSIGLVLMLPFLLRGGLAMMRTQRHGLFAARGMISAATQAVFFISLGFLPMADAVSLTFTAPLFGTVLAVVLLGEVFRARRLAATLVGFAGALIILRPGFAEITWLTITPLLAAIGMAVIWVQVKMLARTEPTDRVVMYMMVYSVPITFAMALTVWQTPEWRHVPWLVATAVAANVGQFAMTNAYRAADATVVFPFDFARLPFAAVLAYFAFAQRPEIWTWLGAVIIFGASVHVGRSEAAAERRRAATAAAPE